MSCFLFLLFVAGPVRPVVQIKKKKKNPAYIFPFHIKIILKLQIVFEDSVRFDSKIVFSEMFFMKQVSSYYGTCVTTYFIS